MSNIYKVSIMLKGSQDSNGETIEFYIYVEASCEDEAIKKSYNLFDYSQIFMSYIQLCLHFKQHYDMVYEFINKTAVHLIKNNSNTLDEPLNHSIKEIIKDIHDVDYNLKFHDFENILDSFEINRNKYVDFNEKIKIELSKNQNFQNIINYFFSLVECNKIELNHTFKDHRSHC